MLSKLEIETYRGFKDKFVFDLKSSKRYNFNKEMLEKRIVKKALIFGINGSGKSNLCEGIMDITYHLVDKQKNIMDNTKYFYAGSDTKKVKFTYYFVFGNTEVKYEYAKISCTELAYEKLYINEEKVIEYNFFDDSHQEVNIKGLESLNITKLPAQLSIIKFISNNSVLKDNSIIKKLIDYVSGMLYFKSLIDGNTYMGYKLGSETLAKIILKNNKLKDFEKFLRLQGLNYDLDIYKDSSNNENIGIKFANGNIINFESIISSGTKTLFLFYCWMLEFTNVSLLIIDEFDAYYHYETAQAVLKLVNDHTGVQSILTTHNTSLMNTKITRPDCCFILKEGNIRPLSSFSNKELRKANNLEKMYKNGEFSDILK